MSYLITIKTVKDGKPAKHEIWESAHDLLNLVRRVFVQAGHDDTSADIQALAFMQKVDNNAAQVLRNEKNGHVMVIQLQATTK